MFKWIKLKSFLHENGEVTPKGEKYLSCGVLLYSLLLSLMCFLPQIYEPGKETPGIQHIGKVVVLLIPFNSIVNFGKIISAGNHVIGIFVQNLMNIFLLSPLIFQLLWLVPNIRKVKKILLLSFSISLFIECTQIILDIVINANRVFEVDDLWTNTLGGYLAFLIYQQCLRKWKKYQSRINVRF